MNPDPERQGKPMRIFAESALQILTLTRLRSHKNVILNEKDAITRLKVKKKYKNKKAFRKCWKPG
jgi:ethanolamine ammonia-lyase large subunit